MLLDALTFTKGPGVPRGKVSLHSAPMAYGMHIRSCIYVPREDSLDPRSLPTSSSSLLTRNV